MLRRGAGGPPGVPWCRRLACMVRQASRLHHDAPLTAHQGGRGFMPFLLLLLLTLACLPEPKDRSQPPAWLGVGGSVWLTWLGVAVVVAAAAALGFWSRLRLRRDPDLRDAIILRYPGWRL